MNGRVYDPELGRFLSADPHVQNPKGSQSYNRYSYVHNNPLRYNDPSGYFLDKVFKEVGEFFNTDIGRVVGVALAVWGGVAAYGATSTTTIASTATVSVGGATVASSTVAFTATTTGSIFAGTVAAGATFGAISGATSGVAQTGTFGGLLRGAARGGLQGAISGSIFGGINAHYGSTWSMGRVAITGAGGGATAELYGGEFEDGFKFAFLTAGMRYLYNKTLGYDATWKSGDGLATPEGTYDEHLGVPEDYNVFGTNTSPLTVDSSGNVKFWENSFKQGGWLSNSANSVPGLHSVARLHDYYQIGLDKIAGAQDSWMRTIFNVPAMAPAAAISYGALLDNPYVYMGLGHYNYDRGERRWLGN